MNWRKSIVQGVSIKIPLELSNLKNNFETENCTQYIFTYNKTNYMCIYIYLYRVIIFFVLHLSKTSTDSTFPL